jgi:predicted Zn-dependent peptidase
VSADEAAEALRREVYRMTDETVDSYELEKVKNKYEHTFVFSQYKAADRAMALCHYTWLGDTELVNREPEEYRKITSAQLLEAAREVFNPNKENRLFYLNNEAI